MVEKKITKDEKYLLALYDAVKNSEEPEDLEIDPYSLGEKIGLSPNVVKAIVAQLIRGNFAKKAGPHMICITNTGIRVAKMLR